MNKNISYTVTALHFKVQIFTVLALFEITLMLVMYWHVNANDNVMCSLMLLINQTV